MVTVTGRCDPQVNTSYFCLLRRPRRSNTLSPGAHPTFASLSPIQFSKERNSPLGKMASFRARVGNTQDEPKHRVMPESDKVLENKMVMAVGQRHTGANLKEFPMTETGII